MRDIIACQVAPGIDLTAIESAAARLASLLLQRDLGSSDPAGRRRMAAWVMAVLGRAEAVDLARGEDEAMLRASLLLDLTLELAHSSSEVFAAALAAAVEAASRLDRDNMERFQVRLSRIARQLAPAHPSLGAAAAHAALVLMDDSGVRNTVFAHWLNLAVALAETDRSAAVEQALVVAAQAPDAQAQASHYLDLAMALAKLMPKAADIALDKARVASSEIVPTDAQHWVDEQIHLSRMALVSAEAERRILADAAVIAARRIRHADFKCWAWADLARGLAPYYPEDCASALAELADDAVHDNTLVDVVEGMVSADAAFDAWLSGLAARVSDPGVRTRAWVALAGLRSGMPLRQADEAWRNALTAARQIPMASMRAAALAEIAELSILPPGERLGLIVESWLTGTPVAAHCRALQPMSPVIAEAIAREVNGIV